MKYIWFISEQCLDEVQIPAADVSGLMHPYKLTLTNKKRSIPGFIFLFFYFIIILQNAWIH